MHILAAIIAEVLDGYPVTESMRGITRTGGFTCIEDRDVPDGMVYAVKRGTVFFPPPGQ